VNQGYIPQTLDKPEQFLFFDVDQFIIATSIVGVGISIGSMVGGLIAGVVTARQYGKLKSGKHPKFAVHLLTGGCQTSFSRRQRLRRRRTFDIFWDSR